MILQIEDNILRVNRHKSLKAYLFIDTDYNTFLSSDLKLFL